MRTLYVALGAIQLLDTCKALKIGRRALNVPEKPVGNWTSQGCYVDVGRTLAGGGYDDNNAMTIESCIKYCSIAGYIYAGTEYSSQCYCGNTLATGSGPASTGSCNMPCTDNATEACGGRNALNLYWSGTNGPQTNPGNGAWSFAGCCAEGTYGRSLPNGVTTTGGSSLMTVELCLSACHTAGYPLAGVKDAGQCWCGNSIENGGAFASDGISGCDMLCNGNYSEYCGGSNSLGVYDYKHEVNLPSWTTTTFTTKAKSTTTVKLLTTVKPSTTSKSPVAKTSSIKSIATATIPGVNRIESSSSKTTSSLAVKPSVGAFIFKGCYSEATNERALSSSSFFDYTAMTLEECAADCTNYDYFGVEYGGECYCGNTLNVGSVQEALMDCNMVCPGNQYEYCGAGDRLELYLKSGAAATGTLKSMKIATTSAAGVSVSTPAQTGFPDGWNHQGCYVDGANGRILSHQQPDNQELTQQSCVETCATAGYTIAGMEYSVECFCDNDIYNGGALAADQSDCSDPCSGNPAEICGGGSRMTLYSKGTPEIYASPAAQTSGLPANWQYKGCLQDNIASSQDANQILSTFPYQVQLANNTPTACIEQCHLYGFNACGLEYGSQCWCGDVENIYVASAPTTSTDPDDTQTYIRSAQPQIVADSECNSICSGDGRYLCGAGSLLTYYAWSGAEPLYTWNFPTGNNAGEYSLLIGGLTVPLITSQAVNGKVTFVEKMGTGNPNGTGVYELDLSEIDNFDAAWRTMDGLQTDVFCAAGLILPDKAGRQITVGGWAGDSNFGVRLYWPDGSPGVKGTNEWIEDPGGLSLQVPRWYPSIMTMANGSIMVVGGEIGNNEAEEPSLELLPATGVPTTGTTSGYSNTTVYLEFLDRTQPFNLYPFVCVVPSGIFIAYYNEARILNEVTFETVKTLPNMPGAVNDDTGGRSYQLEGSMVLLPQHAPYTENLGVLICGGSTAGGGYAIDNCISTRPEDDSAAWTIERMPSRRVMPCMAGLPDGTYVIVNGGQHGVAGFGLGGDPNYNAILYDPTKPVNTRMSVMANTTVARLYHSEAIVLLDGRVMISGSDPTGDYDEPAGSFPEEYRVEVFTPPYLLSGLARPTYTMTNTDWAYGEAITITVTSGTVSAISMLGAVVTTHGNAFGQRTIFPGYTCSGNTCTITAPPNAHQAPPGWFMLFILNGPTPSVGQFIRIGGDPGKIGDWPAKIPAFAPLPGM